MQPNQFRDEQGNPKPDAPQAQNQFTTGKRKGHDDATRDKMRAEKLAARLYAYAAQEKDENGKEVVMDQGRIAAAKILIDKGKPSLQAVEQTQVSEWESMSEDELKATVRALITSHPELIREFAPGPEPVDNAVQHAQTTDTKAA